MGLVFIVYDNGILVTDIKRNPQEITMELPEQPETLLEVRCPYERISKSDGKLYKCNSLCVKVAPGSAGEGRCRKCGLNFLFFLDDSAKVQTGVRVQTI